MIKAANDKIIVSVEFSQKEKISINNTEVLLAKQYSHNRRESHPVMCKVVNGNGHFKEGELLLVHHNRFSEHSPHHLGDNLYSLAYNESIFAKLDKYGDAKSVCGNVIVKYIYPESEIPLPAHLMIPHPHKYMVASNGFGYKKGQIVFAYDKSDYEIVHVFDGAERREVKVKS